MGFVQAVKSFYRNYFNFKGRSSRSEYWWPALLMAIFYIPLIIINEQIGPSGTVGGLELVVLIVTLLFFLVSIIPSIAVTIRRLHDQNRSGWWVLISLVPIISLVLIVFMCLPGTHGPNRFGPNPLGTADVFD